MSSSIPLIYVLVGAIETNPVQFTYWERGMTNSRILCISDIHAPFQHHDTYPFLKAIKAKYKPDRIICLGDEISGNQISFHDKDPDALFSPDTEFQAAIDSLGPIYKLFPKVDLMESNHGALVYRKAKFHGLPKRVLKSYREIIEAPKGWRWHPHLTIKMSNGEKVFFHHGKSTKAAGLSKDMNMSAVEGHYHTRFEIVYWKGGDQVSKWGMKVGCMIDNDAYDFNYNKSNLGTVMLGHGIILDGVPKLLPMNLNKKGRWDGIVP